MSALEFKEVLKKRRSYRKKFSDRKVTREELKYIIEAAYMAPSGRNLQTARIIGVLEEQKVNKIAEICGYEWAKDTTACVVIVTKEILGAGNKPSRHKEDFGAAAENLLLAVTDLGLATTWVQGYIENEKGIQIEKLLNVPDDYYVIGYFPIGEPEEEVKDPKKLSFKDCCFIEEFGKEFNL